MARKHVTRGCMWQRCICLEYSVFCLTKIEPVAASECLAYQQATEISVECVMMSSSKLEIISYFLGAIFQHDQFYLEKNKLYPYQD